MSAARTIRRRGSPLVMLAVLLGSWVAARAATWETPLGSPGLPLAVASGLLSIETEPASGTSGRKVPTQAPQSVAYPRPQDYPRYAPYAAYGYDPAYQGYAQPAGFRSESEYRQALAYAAGYAAAFPARQGVRRVAYEGAYPGKAPSAPVPMQEPMRSRLNPRDGEIASAHQLLMREAFGVDWHSSGVRSGAAVSGKRPDKRRSAAQQVAPPPFAAQPLPTTRPAADRWSLDVFGFYRQGSSLLSISQGRNPIYGASQVGANLQWRALPSSSHDPRLYARAYRALVNGGESEIAAGASALPIGAVPIRVYGELRLTRNPPDAGAGLPARTDFRPAAYAATEIPPQKLPLGFSLEAYAAGGYVWGDADTYFLDAQSALTRQVANFRNPDASSAALSLGGGVWGGAQRDANRVDIGPTLRLDMNLGQVPARISVDYREQVAGDAEPDSGIAATVSTRF